MISKLKNGWFMLQQGAKNEKDLYSFRRSNTGCYDADSNSNWAEKLIKVRLLLTDPSCNVLLVNIDYSKLSLYSRRKRI